MQASEMSHYAPYMCAIKNKNYIFKKERREEQRDIYTEEH
jgi:hypothetical protein